VRIVSLCPSLTELVFDLGRGRDLVGITKYCVHPADRVGALEKVGGTKNPSVCRIIEIAPDLVLLNDEENRIEDAEALRAAGIPLHTSMPRSIAETAAMVRSIGRRLEREAAAEEIAHAIESNRRRLCAATRGKPAVSWAYLIWRKPWMTVNADTFVHALLAEAGGRNVFADRPDRYPAIPARDLAAADPDVIFLGTEPFPFAAGHIAELVGLTGIEPARFRVADGQYLSWHGSRTVAGIEYAGKLIEEARARSAARRRGRGAGR